MWTWDEDLRKIKRLQGRKTSRRDDMFLKAQKPREWAKWTGTGTWDRRPEGKGASVLYMERGRGEGKRGGEVGVGGKENEKKWVGKRKGPQGG